jgi:hypothetical protein
MTLHDVSINAMSRIYLSEMTFAENPGCVLKIPLYTNNISTFEEKTRGI